MPNDAPALVELPMFVTGFPRFQPGDGAVYGAVLLVATDGLDGLATDLHEQHEMSQHIQ